MSASASERSDGESDGPATPETHATEASAAVPALALDSSPAPPDTEDVIALVTARVQALGLAGTPEKKRRRNSVARFMDDLRRIKIRV